MWYLKTKLGTLWIVQSEDAAHPRYVLGMDDDSLGLYESIDKALEDVYNHATGALKWDESLKASAPVDIKQWIEGEPESWNNITMQ